MSDNNPVVQVVPMFELADSEARVLAQCIWLLEQRAMIADDLKPPMLTLGAQQRIAEFLHSRYACIQPREGLR